MNKQEIKQAVIDNFSIKEIENMLYNAQRKHFEDNKPLLEDIFKTVNERFKISDYLEIAAQHSDSMTKTDWGRLTSHFNEDEPENVFNRYIEKRKHQL